LFSTPLSISKTPHQPLLSIFIKGNYKNGIKFNKYLKMEWKKYKFLDRTFEVSASGKVRNEHGKIIKGSLHTDGFRSINIRFYHNEERYTKGLIIHRMVAKCWVENLEMKPYVIHLNGDLLDNRAKNLAWATAAEKIVHQKKVGKVHPGVKLTPSHVAQIKKMLAEKLVTIEDIARKFGVSHTQIQRIKREENWADLIVLVSNSTS
jgi:NUMOD4 motif